MEKPAGLWGIVKANKVDMMGKLLKEKDDRIASLTREMDALRQSTDHEARAAKKEYLHQKLQLGLYKAEREEARNECRVLRERIRYYEQKNNECLQAGDPDSEMHQLQASKHLLLIRITNLEDKYYALRGKYKEFFMYLDTRVKIAQHSVSEVRNCVHNEVQAMRHWMNVQSRALFAKAQLLHSVDWDVQHDARVLQGHVAELVQETNSMLDTYRRESFSTDASAVTIQMPSLRPEEVTPVVSGSEFALEIMAEPQERERIDAFSRQLLVIREVAGRMKSLEQALVYKRSFQGQQLRSIDLQRLLEALKKEAHILLKWFHDNLDAAATSMRTAGVAFQRACIDTSPTEVTTVQFLVQSSQDIPSELTTLNCQCIVLKTSHNVLRRNSVRFGRTTACCQKVQAACKIEYAAALKLEIERIKSRKDDELVPRKPSVEAVKPTLGLRMMKAAKLAKKEEPSESPPLSPVASPRSPPPPAKPKDAIRNRFQKSVQKTKILKTFGGGGAPKRASISVPTAEKDSAPSPKNDKNDKNDKKKKKLCLMDVSSLITTQSKLKRRLQGKDIKAANKEPETVETGTGSQTIQEDTCTICRLPRACVECMYSDRLESMYPLELIRELSLVKQKINAVELLKVECWERHNSTLRKMMDLLRFSGRVVRDAPPKLAALEEAVKNVKNTTAPPQPGAHSNDDDNDGDIHTDKSAGFMAHALSDGNGPTAAGRLVLTSPTVIPLLHEHYQREVTKLAKRGHSPDLPTTIPQRIPLSSESGDPVEKLDWKEVLSTNGIKGLLKGVFPAQKKVAPKKVARRTAHCTVAAPPQSVGVDAATTTEDAPEAVIRLPEAQTPQYYYVASSVVEQKKRGVLYKKKESLIKQQEKLAHEEGMMRLSPRHRQRSPYAPSVTPGGGCDIRSNSPALNEPLDISLDVLPGVTVLHKGEGFSEKGAPEIMRKIEAANGRKSATVPRFPCLKVNSVET